MAKKSTFFYIVSSLFVLLVFFVFLWVALNYNDLRSEINTVVIAYGLLGIFVIALLTDMLFQPIGPDIPIIFGIVGGLNPYHVYFAATLASLLASLIGYALGRLYGVELFQKVYGAKRYTKWSKFYQKHGKWSTLIAALSPVPYVPFCWMAGIFSFKRRNFILFALVPRTIRFVLVAWVTVFAISL